MFMFTDFNASPVDRHTYGYYFLYYVAALIAINVIVLVVSVGIECRWNYRRWYILRQRKKNQKNAKEVKALTVRDVNDKLSEVLDGIIES